MNADVQKQFMYLFERIGEPLYYGPRGKDNMYYNVPMPPDSKMQHAAVSFRQNAPESRGGNVAVKAPKEMPNLSRVNTLCPKNAIFSYFSDNHLKGVREIKNALMHQSNLQDFMSMASVCRDSTMVNSQLWVFAFASAALERPDMKGFKIPAFVEICPDMFITPAVTKLAQQQAVMPKEDRSVIEVSRTPTGNDANPENKLAYFREDIGVNSHHWHWHLVYTRDTAKGVRDRKGELFYYMHHSVLARYNAERLGNNLPLTKRLDLNSETIEEGYFPKLYSTNAGVVWGTRQERTRLQDVNRPEANTRLEDLRKFRDRIYEAIDAKVILGPNRDAIPLAGEAAIDLLGDIVESSELSPNSRYYGSLHNLGHDVLAFAQDPYGLHRENMGVLGDTPTAMRDPVFYRWHTFVDEIFDKFKQTLPPYSNEELSWNGIQVTDFSVKSDERSSTPNILVTNWLQSDVDLARGLDLGRTRSTGGAIWARFTHLDHEKFTYTITVNNAGNQAVNGTVRIFMAPRTNETGRRFNMNQQRQLFFEMDKFAYSLKPGTNVIDRKSSESAVTIPWEQSFQQLEKLADTMRSEIGAVDAVCGCGWPQNMLLPRGTTTGQPFDLYVIVTNGAQDQIMRKRSRTAGQEQNCKESISYCGILDELYPDKRAMGFPFDRVTALDSNNQIINLDAFVLKAPNSKYVQIKIIHRGDVTKIRAGGAPTSMSTMKEPQPTSPPGSPNTSRPGSPSPIGRDEFVKGPTRPSIPPTVKYPTSPTRPPSWSKSTFGGSDWGQPTTPPPPTRPPYRPGGRWSPPSRWGRPGREASRSPPPEEWTYI